MKRYHALFLICILCSMGQESLADNLWEEVVTIGGVEIGHKNHNLDEMFDSPLNFYMLSANITAAYKNYYLGAHIARSIAETSISEDGETGEAERSDLDVVLGWNINNNVTLFTGYKKGKTELNMRTREIEGIFEDIQVSFNSRFELAGPYLGGAYTFRFAEQSQLTLSFAYAWLEANNHLESGSDIDIEELEDLEDLLDFDDLETKSRNDAQGYSIGKKWTAPITNNLYYTALFRFNKYEQKIRGELGGFSRTFKVDERFIDMNFGVIYVF